MKKIESELKNAKWENRLLNDLSFIKKHGRYSITARTIRPLGALIWFFILLATVLMRAGIRNATGDKKFAVVILGVICLLFTGIVIYNFYTIFSFKKIATRYYLQKNQQLLINFFKSQQLAYTQHADAPEVFLILSKNLSLANDYREVMIFITDDKQILINSHFTGSKFSLTPPSKHYRQMANRLKEWINIHIDNENTVIVPAN